MKEPARTLKKYRTELSEALDDTFQRKILDNFAISYRESRKKMFDGLDERALIEDIAARKDAALSNLHQLYEQFRVEAEKRGTVVHLAKNADDANRIILEIARENDCREVVKSKSMTVEEIRTNTALEQAGLKVVETDLAEWIIQLRGEGPSHMVLPSIHLSRSQVAETFSAETGVRQNDDISHLVRVARKELRPHFVSADMGITGANFAIAETGTIGLVTNEGNARLVTTLPRVHVAVCGIDKLIPAFEDALATLKVLPRNATGQYITSYVTWIGGAVPTAQQSTVSSTGVPDGRKRMHVIFLDNGRLNMLQDPVFAQALRCVRCGACANVCPVYRLVGGHRMGYIYIGAIGLILTYIFHGKERARALIHNCVNCQACKHVCSAGIDLPRLIEEIRMRFAEEEGAGSMGLLSATLKNRKLFHTLLRFAKYAQKPLTGGEPFIRHLPTIFAGDHNFRALPAIAETPFRDRWVQNRAEIWPEQPQKPTLRVALFAGCMQDFVYPEQLEALLKILRGRNIAVSFPLEQSCCGLPLVMMGQRQIAREVARQNIIAMTGDYDVILTLCASCASHLKHGYPVLFANENPAQDPHDNATVKNFADKVMDFSTFARKILDLKPDDFLQGEETVTYHASCHLCRGLGVNEAPRELIAAAAHYVPCKEENVCCGFGGTYSVKFPQLSAELLHKKLGNIAETGAQRLVADCPGCIMQIRGGAKKAGNGLKVTHIAELVAEHLKR